MNKVLYYAKFISIFLIIELMLTFITSLLNLMGLNSGITSIILFISNIMLFFVLSFYNAFKKKKKGFLEGIILGGIFLILMIIIKFILFSRKISISTILYYLILLITSIFGSIVGVNKKSEE